MCPGRTSPSNPGYTTAFSVTTHVAYVNFFTKIIRTEEYSIRHGLSLYRGGVKINKQMNYDHRLGDE